MAFGVATAADRKEHDAMRDACLSEYHVEGCAVIVQ